MKSATTKCESRAKRSFRYRTKNVWLYLARPAFSNKSNVFTSTRAFENVRTHIHDGICGAQCIYSSNNRGYIHFHPRFTHPHSCAGQHSAALFFFSLSSTSFLDIKAFNIERRIAMRPDSARGQSVLSGGREFRDKFSPMREPCRFDKSKKMRTAIAICC